MMVWLVGEGVVVRVVGYWVSKMKRGVILYLLLGREGEGFSDGGNVMDSFVFELMSKGLFGYW